MQEPNAKWIDFEADIKDIKEFKELDILAKIAQLHR